MFQVMSSSTASSAITALSPGGVLMQGGGQQTVNRETDALFLPPVRTFKARFIDIYPLSLCVCL